MRNQNNWCKIKLRTRRFLHVALTMIAAMGFVMTAQAQDYGKPGDPIHLTIGYQPYYTQAWSAVIQKEQEFWKKYLPAGSTVDWRIGLQGAIIVNAMLAGKHDIGYMGDMPAIVAASKYSVRDLRIVATLGLAYDQCSIFMVRNDAPDFKTPKDAVLWVNGKRTAVAKGSCTDSTAQAIFKEFNIKPAAYLNQNIEVQTSGFKAGKLDASIIWEPTASKLVLDGIARRGADAGVVDKRDAGFMAMQAELIKQRPDVVDAWLRAELDANLYWSKPENYMSVVEMALKNTQGFSKQALWMSMAGKYPPIQGGTDFRNIMYYGFNEDTEKLIANATKFLHEVKTVSEPKLRDIAVMPEFTDKILKERGLTVPLAKIIAQPPSSYPEGGITLPATWRE